MQANEALALFICIADGVSLALGMLAYHRRTVARWCKTIGRTIGQHVHTFMVAQDPSDDSD